MSVNPGTINLVAEADWDRRFPAALQQLDERLFRWLIPTFRQVRPEKRRRLIDCVINGRVWDLVEAFVVVTRYYGDIPPDQRTALIDTALAMAEEEDRASALAALAKRLENMDGQERNSIFNASSDGFQDEEHQVTALAGLARQIRYMQQDQRQFFFHSMFGIGDEGDLADVMKRTAYVAEHMTGAELEAFLTKTLAISGEFQRSWVLEVLATKLQPMSDDQRRRYFNTVLAIADISIRTDMVVAIRQAVQTLNRTVRAQIHSVMPVVLQRRRANIAVSSSLPVIELPSSAASCKHRRSVNYLIHRKPRRTSN
jgi:hypothetical protein